MEHNYFSKKGKLRDLEVYYRLDTVYPFKIVAFMYEDVEHKSYCDYRCINHVKEKYHYMKISNVEDLISIPQNLLTETYQEFNGLHLQSVDEFNEWKNIEDKNKVNDLVSYSLKNVTTNLEKIVKFREQLLMWIDTTFKELKVYLNLELLQIYPVATLELDSLLASLRNNRKDYDNVVVTRREFGDSFKYYITLNDKNGTLIDSLILERDFSNINRVKRQIKSLFK